MIKVLQICKYCPSIPGGIEKVCYYINKYINNKDIEIYTFCFDTNIKNNNDKIKKFPITWNLFSTPISISFFWEFLKIKDFDIIHLHLPNPIATIALIVFNIKIPIIIHWHSDIVSQKKLFYFYKPIQNIIIKKSKKIIATSEIYAQNSKHISKYKDKIQIIQLGTEKIQSDKIDTKTIEKIKYKFKDKNIILSVGRMTKYKGYDVLINAARYTKKSSIILVCGGGKYLDEYKRIVKNNNLEEKIFFLGFVDEDLLCIYYNIADVFCLPSISKAEAFGIVLLEAMSIGLPIIATSIPGSGVSWVNQNGITGINVPPNDHIALAGAINYMIDNPDIRNRMGSQAKNRYINFFTAEKMTSKIQELYIKIAKRE